MKKLYTLIVVIAFAPWLLGNNITVSNLILTGKNTTNHTFQVQFDISWNNSFRVSTGPSNWDAAWVFFKYKIAGNYLSEAGATSASNVISVGSTTGLRVGMPVRVTAGVGAFRAGTLVLSIQDSRNFTVTNTPATALSGGATVVTGYQIWQHVDLQLNNFVAPAGSSISVANDGKGAFIYSDVNFKGTFSKTGVQLQWRYSDNGVGDNTSVDIQGFAIEMVRVPQASFSVGTGGSEPGSFYTNPNTATTFSITSEAAINVGQVSGYLDYNNTSLPNSGDQAGPIPAGYPKGYAGFYCMKYEISQQGYVDFLNTLPRIFQTKRVRTDIMEPITTVTYRFVMHLQTYAEFRNGIRCDPTIPASDPVTFYCDFDANGVGGQASDGQWIACNLISWADMAAYLAWSALRPMTELEYEKACRGTMNPVIKELAWGNENIASKVYVLVNSGYNNEGVSTNYASNGNLIWNATRPASTSGPFRVGLFAANAANSGRGSSGATYYGIMEMSGNMAEYTVSAGNPDGRGFTGTHGAGSLNAANQEIDVPTWPSWTGTGMGRRGGSWSDTDQTSLLVSTRALAAYGIINRTDMTAGRGVRTY